MKDLQTFFIAINIFLCGSCFVADGVQIYENLSENITQKALTENLTKIESEQLSTASTLSTSIIAATLTAPISENGTMAYNPPITEAANTSIKNSEYDKQTETSTKKNVIVNNVSAFQPMNGYRKRQLFPKSQQQIHHQNSTGNDEKIVSSTMTLNTKDFIPSPQIDTFYTNQFDSNTMNDQVEDYRNTNQLYRPQTDRPYYHVSTNYHHSSYPKETRWTTEVPSIPSKYSSNYENEEKGQVIWQAPMIQSQPQSDKGHFIWVPETTDKPQEETKMLNHPYTSNNNTGNWKWIETEENPNSNVEGKIISHNIPTPYFYHHEQKPQSINVKDHPYSFDSVDTPFSYGPSSSNNDSPPKTSESMTFHKDSGNGIMKHQKTSHWKKIIHVLSAAIPIGLIISALTPHVVYVNPNTTVSNSSPMSLTSKYSNLMRQRSLNIDIDERGTENTGKKMTNPLMDFLNILGDGNHASQNTACEDRIFCEMSRLGEQNDADVLNKMLWKIANDTPEKRARQSGLGELFWAIRENRCTIYNCESNLDVITNKNNYN